ncbi:hypothetical protein [Streptomyces sp. bgisy130]|uniref:hypothetical protein n=1 Tax=Streptomyces sp. bgisy130 TaxID=3413788 RepID=UPI003F4A0CD0
MRKHRPPCRTRAHLGLLSLLAGTLILIPVTTAHADGPLVFANPSFESGATDDWTFTTDQAGVNENPHSGSKSGYLNQGSGYSMSQTVTAPQSGTYDFSGWFAASGDGGSLVIKVNGTAVGSAASIPSQQLYNKQTVSRISVDQGDEVTFEVDSSPNGWVNVDDVEVSPTAPNDPQIGDSDCTGNDCATLRAMFSWAKAKANSWVRMPDSTGPINADENTTGGSSTGTYSTTYWAGYPYRSDFYLRDTAHQVVGAHLLGLDAENETMLKAFAASANDSNTSGTNDPYWSINFDAKTPGSIDYSSSTSFVRELPAPFELVQKINDAYTWTGDSDYVSDSTLSTYVSNTVGSSSDTTSPFIKHHTPSAPVVDNGDVPIPEATSNSIFDGTATYNEGSGAALAQAGDAVGSQYQAYLAAANLAKANNDSTNADHYSQAATDLRDRFNSTWSGDSSDDTASNVVRAYDTSGNQVTGWGNENSWFMPLKNLMNPGTRANNYLSYIDTQATDSGPANLEAYTYLPDVYFQHPNVTVNSSNSSDTAWKWMQYVYSKIGDTHTTGKFLNGDYPEISFTLVSQIVQGLMGIQPDAGNALSTLSQLPGNISTLQVSSIPVGSGTVTLKHSSATDSTLSNTSSSGSYSWTAKFLGKHTNISVCGSSQTPSYGTTTDGSDYTYATVDVSAGQSCEVSVSD